MISLFLALSVAAATTDTLVVGRAEMEGPIAIGQPYRVDSLNMQGKTFDVQELLKQNAAMIQKTATRNRRTSEIRHREALTVGADSLPTMRIIRFTIQSPRYAEGRIEVKHLKHYKLFVDSREVNDKKWALAPGRSEVAIQVLTDKAACDSFDVCLIGDDLKDVVINATEKHPYTMADMMQGLHYRSVALSPSGRYLVTSQYYLKPDGKVQYQTVLTEMKSGRELFRRNEYLALSWLPSLDDVLYYTRTGAMGKELVVYTPADGREKVLADRLPEGSFSVSPKADYLIFNKTDEGKKTSKSLKRLEEPDDRMSGWRNRNQLWRYDLESGLLQRLTFGQAGVHLADISADGRHLLLQYSRFDAARAPFDRTTFLRMDAYTGRVDTLLGDTTFVASARFSPNGEQLLISASPNSFGEIGSELKPGQPANAFDYRLYLYDIATKEVKPLQRGFKPSVNRFEWSKGDGQIYLLTTDGTGRTLFRLDPKTGKTMRYEMPVSYIQGYSIATLSGRNPRCVLFGQTAERAREMFSCQLTKERPEVKRIGEIDFDWMVKDVAIGSYHPWKFRATRGDSIDGFYLLPPNFDAVKKYPMIVYYYGGCTPTTACLEFQYPLQVLAAQGYVVYVPNPSGTIGYGQEFAARHVNTWGQESGDDIIEGTKQFCKEHSFVDANRIGCMGASYGGFMTQYLQTRTDIFATAVSHAGISNIASYWGGGYWGYSYGSVAQYGSYPWNNPKLYVEQSPLFHADKIHTPLLLLHGTVDTNVPTTESQQLYNALKILGREVCYVQVEGENHVIVDFNKRLAWQNVIFAWFAKYLQKDDRWWKSLNL